MTLTQQLETELKVAMRSGDELKKRTLRMALSAIRLAEVDRRAAPDDAAVLAILQREIKSRNESIEDARRANRDDLVEANLAEINVLMQFMPQPLSEAELEELARQAIAEVRAVGLNELGKVMKVLAPRLKGRATGEQASRMVRKLLTP